MIESSVIRAIYVEELRIAGFERRGRLWLRTGADVRWVLQIDRSPRHGDVYSVVGVDLGLGELPTRADDCGIVVYPETMTALDDDLSIAGIDRSQVRIAGALTTAMSLEDRKRVIGAAVTALARYIDRRLTAPQVARSLESREFQTGFVRKDVRAQLSGS